MFLLLFVDYISQPLFIWCINELKGKISNYVP